MLEKFHQKVHHGEAHENNPQVAKKKSRIRETKHLLTDVDSSTDAIGGCTKNKQKPDLFENRKKSPKTQNSETSRNMTK